MAPSVTVPRTLTRRPGAAKNAIDDASQYERFSGILGTGVTGSGPAAVASVLPSAASVAPRTMVGAATHTSGG